MQAEKVNQVAATNPWLSEAVFSTACSALPLVSIDLMVTRPGDQGRELLLGLRTNRPAQGWWFTPGGRIRKNEPPVIALQRVAQEEIGLNTEWLCRAQLLGAWDHFYLDSAFSTQVSTHYVNLPHVLYLTRQEALVLCPPYGEDMQHKAWEWVLVTKVKADNRVHEYVRSVMDELNQSLVKAKN